MAIRIPARPIRVATNVGTVAVNVQPSASPPKVGGIKRRETIVQSTHEITGELAQVVNNIRATFGPAIITKASSEKVHYGRLNSGVLSVDLCLGGGFMRSRGNMLYGNKSAGKSTLALIFAAAAQRQSPDKYVTWLDFEGTFDGNWAKRFGVNLDQILVVEPETGEAGVDIADALFRAHETSMVVTDSIAMITSMKEIANSAEDQLPGIHARLMGNYIRRLNQAMLEERHKDHYPVLLHLNQFRMSIGLTFGDPRVLPGGRALEFSTSQQIEATNKEHFAGEDKGSKETKEAGEKAEKNKLVVYNEHSIKITKDKTGGRIKEGKFKLIRDESMGLPVGYIDQSKTIINLGLAKGVLSGAPNSFSHDTYGKWKGQPDFVQWLVEHRDAERDIAYQIVEVYRKQWGIT